MSTRGTASSHFAPGLLYHVIVRGNHREKTFWTDRDYRVYLERLGKNRGKHKVNIYAYCQMPNHTHLLVETCGPHLAKFMQGLQQSYTQHFNRKYEKVGHLFQGRYRLRLLKCFSGVGGAAPRS